MLFKAFETLSQAPDTFEFGGANVMLGGKYSKSGFREALNVVCSGQ